MELITPDDLKRMVRAVELEKLSVPEDGRIDQTPLVGAVIVDARGKELEGFRGMTGPGDHAEFGAIKMAGFPDLAGATVYTTLEPCVKRGKDKIPCSTRLAESKVAKVWMGVYDPHPSVAHKGWRRLVDARIVVRDFPIDLRAEILNDNDAFMSKLRVGDGDQGSAEFDYTQNGGEFLIQNTSSGSFLTKWTTRSGTSIYAVDNRFLVGDSALAQRFEEIDDPMAWEWKAHSVAVDVGRIVMFRNGSGGHALVRVVSVASESYGGETNAVKIEWLIRPS